MSLPTFFKTENDLNNKKQSPKQKLSLQTLYTQTRLSISSLLLKSIDYNHQLQCQMKFVYALLASLWQRKRKPYSIVTINLY